MMTKTYIIPLIALLTWMCLPAAADNVRTEWIDSTQVKIAYSLTGNAERNYAICATPVLTDGQGHSLSLPGAVFRSKANRRYVERGRLYGTEQPAVTREPASGDTLHCEQLISRTDVPLALAGSCPPRRTARARRLLPGGGDAISVVGQFLLCAAFRAAHG